MITAAEWLAFAGSGIGVLGTLAGAAIATVFANQAERRRAVESRDGQVQLWAREDSLRFHNDKAIAYSAFIGKMHLWHRQLISQLHGEYGGQAYKPLGGFDLFETEVTQLMAQIELIAPHSVWSAVEIMWGAGSAIALTLSLPDQYSEEHRNKNVTDFGHHLIKCVSVMREDLGGGRGAGRGILIDGLHSHSSEVQQQP